MWLFWISPCLASLCKTTVLTYFWFFFVHKTQCVNFKFHIYNKTLLGLEILCHIVYLLSLIFWFSMWRVCLRNFCHDFIIYKLLLLLCHILFEVLQAKLYCSSILLCIHFNHPLYMRGSRNFSQRGPRPFSVILIYVNIKKFKDPPPFPFWSAHANMVGNAIPAWIGGMLKK